MKKIRGVLIDTQNGISAHYLEYNDYKDIARLLKCNWITCVTRNIGGLDVDVYCDEEGLLKNHLEPAIITYTKDSKVFIVEMLFGNCFICTHNKHGDIARLKSKDIKSVMLAQASMTFEGKKYCVLKAII